MNCLLKGEIKLHSSEKELLHCEISNNSDRMVLLLDLPFKGDSNNSSRWRFGREIHFLSVK